MFETVAKATKQCEREERKKREDAKGWKGNASCRNSVVLLGDGKGKERERGENGKRDGAAGQGRGRRELRFGPMLRRGYDGDGEAS